MDNNIPKESLNCRKNDERILSLEKGMQYMSEKIDRQAQVETESLEMLAKLDTLVEFMVEDRKEQKEINKGFIESIDEDRKEQRRVNEGFMHTLGGMNDNLTQLNNDVKYVISDNKKIKQQVDSIETNQNKSSSISKIDLLELATRVVTKIIEYLMYGGILYVVAKVVLESGIGQ